MINLGADLRGNWARFAVAISGYGLVISLLFASAQTRADEWPKVVATIAPLHSLVANLMVEGEPPELLFDRPAGGHHHAALRPTQVRALLEADLLVWVGPVIEEPVAEVLANNSIAGRQWRAIDCAGQSLMKQPGISPNGDDHGHSDHRTAEKLGNIDPHVWLNPTNALCYLNELTQILTELDPPHEFQYRANAERTRERLLRLDQQLGEQFSAISGPFMTYHNSFNYLLNRYGLSAVGGLVVVDDRPPALRQVLNFRQQLKQTGVSCLLADSSSSLRKLEQWRAGTSARVELLDVMGTALVPGTDLYFQLLQTMTNQISRCLQQG